MRLTTGHLDGARGDDRYLAYEIHEHHRLARRDCRGRRTVALAKLDESLRADNRVR
jgi:hypothetical protein